MRRFVLVFLLLVAPAQVLSAQTLTTRDMISLTKSGLGEEVLLALIEVHRPVFPIDPDTLKLLKDAGVPQSVIVAMVRSGRELPQADLRPVPISDPELPGVSSAAPPVVVVERSYEERPVREIAVPVAVPVYVPVRLRSHRDIGHPVKPVEPVFWGFGGKLRPDAWKPDPPQTPWKPGEPWRANPPQKK